MKGGREIQPVDFSHSFYEQDWNPTINNLMSAPGLPPSTAFMFLLSKTTPASLHSLAFRWLRGVLLSGKRRFTIR